MANVGTNSRIPNSQSHFKGLKMSSSSICSFLECEQLASDGCQAFRHPEKDCPISKFGFLRENQIFSNVYAFSEMGEIYKCVYNNMVKE
jgi:hypothetical protein